MSTDANTCEGFFTTELLVTNIHCPSCISHIQDILRPIPQIRNIDISIIDHVVRVGHDEEVTNLITDTLLSAGFDIQHVSTRNDRGQKIKEHNVQSRKERTRKVPPWPIAITKAQRKHIENCDACQLQREDNSWTSRLRSIIVRKGESEKQASDPSDLERGGSSKQLNREAQKDVKLTEKESPTVYVADISIGGMTCASCSSAITSELESKEFVQKVDINLLQNSGQVTFRGTRTDAQKLVDAIEDIGYEAQICSISPVMQHNKSSGTYKAYLSVEGMTCGSCVGTLTRGIEELPSILSTNIDLVGGSAIVEYETPATIEDIIEKIEDLGYDAALVKLDTLSDSDVAGNPTERNLTFDLVGMYCPRCPTNVAQVLRERFETQLAILDYPSLITPLISIRYTPNLPNLTARHIRDVIESADPAIQASVHHAPTLEERSRIMQQKERSRILRHLLFTLAVAIPSFIIGIVYMSLVPERNSTRRWFEEFVWSGSIMRVEWALFIMTTPAYFYGASIFHSRALMEIWSLWRPGSKVRLLRRFYRFGSMNLLISAGTSVAYFSSLSIMIMEAASPSDTHDGMQSRHSTTYFDSVTFLTLFILVGRFLEAYSKSKTGDAVAMLGNLRPAEALLLDGNVKDLENEGNACLHKVAIDLLEVGDCVLVPHGTSPPVDGVVDQAGEFVFNESSLTGESKPVPKFRGDKVLTGSVNVGHPVKIIVNTLGSHSMLDQIISVVREGQAKRAPIERLADVVTGYFTPVITALAILTWIIWLALGTTGNLPRSWLDVNQGGWPFWSIEFAVAVFVVACPCGIGLAAPTALFVGGGLAAKAGILVQGGGQAFQEASRIDIIVFDKTGTLTEGQMKVTDMTYLDSDLETYSGCPVLKMAKALEESSTHPIAKAIVEYCEEKMVVDSAVQVQASDIKEVSGQGMKGVFRVRDQTSGKVKHFEAAIGNERLAYNLDERSPAVAHCTENKLRKPPTTTTTSQTGNFLAQMLGKIQVTGVSTAIFYVRQSAPNSNVENEWHPMAIFAITDPIRNEAPEVLDNLRRRGIEIHMCTGDNPATAKAIAAQLSIPITHVRAGVLPQDKAAFLDELKHGSNGERRIVTFVGDGTNDTPALSAADVPIALSSGSDVAITAASFIILNSDLKTILKLVRLSKRVFRRVKLNFMWAAVYNICLIPVAAGVFYPIHQWRLSPVWASLAMALSSVSVVLSSLALRLPEFDWKGR